MEFLEATVNVINTFAITTISNSNSNSFQIRITDPFNVESLNLKSKLTSRLL